MAPPATEIRTRLCEAIAAQRAGRPQDAMAIYQAVLIDHPLHPDALNLAGAGAFQMGDHDTARGYLAKAVALRPEHAGSHNNYGQVLKTTGELELARHHFETAISLEPSDAMAYRNLAELNRQQGRLEEALDGHRKCLSLAPQDAETCVMLAYVLALIGHCEKALSAYDKALALAPNFVRAHSERAIVLFDLGRFQEALRSAKHAVALGPEVTVARLRLAGLLQAAGHLEEACQAYRDTLAISPHCRDALYNLGILEQALGRSPEAERAWGRLLEIDPTNDSARHMMDAAQGRKTAIAPPEHIRRTFNDYALTFERHLVEGLAYSAPEAMRELVEAELRDSSRQPVLRRGLDLGCGTGLVARCFTDLVDEIEGLDLAANMVARAQRTGFYKTVIEASVLDFLETRDDDAAPYDLVTAGDLFVYIGDLDDHFAAIAGAMSPRGFFAFSSEDLGSGDYALLASGRYAHSGGYLEYLAQKHGLTLVRLRGIALRKELGQPVSGTVWLMVR